MALVGVLVVALVLGALGTLIIITIAAANRKIRDARRNPEGKQ